MDKNLNRKKRNNKRRITLEEDFLLRDKIERIDYKDVDTLWKIINRQGRINLRIRSRLTSKNQRRITKAIKTARKMALIPNSIANQN